jgi:hypothetical protein
MRTVFIAALLFILLACVVLLIVIARIVTVVTRSRTGSETVSYVRPRVGALIYSDVSSVPIVFHETDDPLLFVATLVDGTPIRGITGGEQLHIDAIGPGQSVTFKLDSGAVDGN